jgi:mannitol/fructose-specific phosphotransferase system IIA component (Ntr-type)
VNEDFFFVFSRFDLRFIAMKFEAPFNLADLLRPDSIQLNLTGKKRDDILDELVGLIPEIKSDPAARATLLRALKEREQLHSTSIGDGIAIPHARNALVGLVQRPVIAFGRQPEGVNYGALDGEPTKMFFLIISPTVTQHLGILARLSRVLRNPMLRKKLLQVETPQRVVTLLRDAESNAQIGASA